MFLASSAVLGLGAVTAWRPGNLPGNALSMTSAIWAPLAAGVALGLAGLGIIALIHTVKACHLMDRKRTTQVLGQLLLVLLGFLAVVVMTVMAGFLAPLGLSILIVMLAARRSWETELPTVPGKQRLGISLAFLALTIAVVVFGVLHILAWNPSAKVPDLSLAQIHAQMDAAGESAGQFMLWAWAGGSISLAALFLVACTVPGLAGFLSLRRIYAIGLLLLGWTAIFHYVAGFNMGMSLADTFAVSGGDAAVGGLMLAITGQIALVAALFVALRPHPAVNVVPAS